jgi:hypothetical protein
VTSGLRTPFDVVAIATRKRVQAPIDAYEAAGATWRIEAVNPLEEPLAEFRSRMHRGPTLRRG